MAAGALHPLLAEALAKRGRVWGEHNAKVLCAMRGSRLYAGGIAGSVTKDGWRSLGDGAFHRVPTPTPETAVA